MRNKLLSVIMLLGLLLMYMPRSLYGSELFTEVTYPPMQGEIAYVMNGDIWLLDLMTGTSQQLTKDGSNQWPAWSNDGRFLLYTHVISEDEFDLYIWDLDTETEPRLLVEDACCAAWEENGERIAYVSLNKNPLTIEAITAEGVALDTILASLLPEPYLSVWPEGNLEWRHSFGEGSATPTLRLPVEFVYNDRSTGTGLTTSADIMFIDPSLGVILGQGMRHWPNCYPLQIAGKRTVLAIAWGNGCTDGEDFPANAAKVIGVVAKDEEHLFPWLAYPSFSPDSRFLVAERYEATDDGANSAIWGLVLVDWQKENLYPLLEAGTQPAWRPRPMAQSSLAPYIQAGEHVVTLEPNLLWQGNQYQVHYLTTSSYKNKTPTLFSTASPSFFSEQAITAFLVTQSNGEIVTDTELLRKIFQLYHSAYYLYEQPPDEQAPEFRSELGLIIDNPLFIAMEPLHALRGQRDQTAGVLRSLVTDQLSDTAYLDALAEQVEQQDPATLEDALGILQKLLQNQADQVKELGELNEDIATVYTRIDKTIRWSQRSSALMRLALRLLNISHLQADRMQWLTTYIEAFPTGDGSLNRQQLGALADVSKEVDSTVNQRQKIILDFFLEQSFEKLLDTTGEILREQTPALTSLLAEKYGWTLSSHAISTALSTVSIGLTVNSILYGSDALVANFRQAQRAEELRDLFRAGRLAVQEEAAASQSTVYDGELADHFRIAWLLERLANAQTHRAYADGVAATMKAPNLAQLLNWLKGEDWETAVEELHLYANGLETDILSRVEEPQWLETSLQLSLERIAQTQQATVGFVDHYDFPVIHPGWTSYTNSNLINDILVTSETVWAATNGGVIRWDQTTGQQTKLTTEHGLVGNDIKAVLQSNDGAIWFATFSGVSRLAIDGSWTSYTTANGLIDNLINSILQSNDGAIWFTTANSGVSRLAVDGTWTYYTSDDGLAANQVNSMLQSNDGTFWFATESGASRLTNDNSWTTYTTNNGLAGNYVTSILQSNDGAVWFATSKGVSRLANDGSWTTYTTNNGLAGNNVRSITQGSDGSLWFGTIGGVSRLDIDSSLNSYTADDGLVSNYITSVIEGSDGSLWFGTLGGVSHLQINGSWATYTPIKDLSNNYAFSMMLQSSDDSLWFASLSGASHLAIDGSWTSYTTADGLIDDTVHFITQSKDGNFWFATSGGVSRLGSEGSWASYTTDNGLVHDWVNSVMQSRDSALWFATNGGASRLAVDGSWTSYTTTDGLVDDQVSYIFQSSDGTLWFATDHGVSRLGIDNSWTSYTTYDGLAHNYVTSSMQSSDGSLWFSTSRGVSRLATNGTWTSYNTIDGLVNSNVNFAMQSRDGTLWFVTSGGVSRLDPALLTLKTDSLSIESFLSNPSAPPAAPTIGDIEGDSADTATDTNATPVDEAESATDKLVEIARTTLVEWARGHEQPFRDETITVERNDDYYAEVRFDLNLRDRYQDSWTASTLYLSCQNVTGNEWTCDSELLPLILFINTGTHRYLLEDKAEYEECENRNRSVGDTEDITLQFVQEGIRFSIGLKQAEVYEQTDTNTYERYFSPALATWIRDSVELTEQGIIHRWELKGYPVNRYRPCITYVWNVQR